MAGFVLRVSLLLLAIAVSVHGQGYKTVVTSDGSIRGYHQPMAGHSTDINVFHGVPFAAPPIGNLRFKKPEPMKPWTGTKDALTIPAACIQSSQVSADQVVLAQGQTQSEDCLYLDIFTPTLDVNASLPVMLWIHGGAFLTGSGSLYYGSELALRHSVVYVTINYRLGIFGYFTSGDNEAPGNYGMFDQLQAMKWVKNNIKNFGGDPDLVTIFGQSAGSMSVQSHLASPLSRGYFARAISQSGAMNYIVPNSFHKSQAAGNLHVAKQAGCTEKSTLMTCLRGKTVKELDDAEKSAIASVYLGVGEYPRFQYVVDKDFLPASPNMVPSYSTVPYMAGIVKNEGGNIAPLFFPLMKTPGFSYDVMRKGILDHVHTYFTKEKKMADRITEALLKGYTGGNRQLTTEQYRAAVTELIGDFDITIDTYHAGLIRPIITGKATTDYFYEMELHPRIDLPKKAAFVNFDHGEDITYVMGFPFIDTTRNYSNVEKEFSKTVMQYWANFAKTGNPNGQGLTKWPLFEVEKQEYLKLSENPEVMTKYKPKLRNLWHVQVPAILDGTSSAAQLSGFHIVTPLIMILIAHFQLFN